MGDGRRDPHREREWREQTSTTMKTGISGRVDNVKNGLVVGVKETPQALIRFWSSVVALGKPSAVKFGQVCATGILES